MIEGSTENNFFHLYDWTPKQFLKIIAAENLAQLGTQKGIMSPKLSQN